MKYFIKLFKLFFGDKSSLIFLCAVLLGLSFSISIIISAAGLMEGFQQSLSSSLRSNRGDLIIAGRRHFFKINEVRGALDELDIKNYAPQVSSEAFLIVHNESQGVLVKGIDSSYERVTNLKQLPLSNEIVIGKELAKQLMVKKGDEIALMFAAGNHQLSGTPILENFIVTDIVSPMMYQESLRIVYVNLKRLQAILGLKEKINQVLLKLSPQAEFSTKHEIIEFKHLLVTSLGYEFKVQTFWERFQGLLKAVQVEKFYIISILQVIVLVSIFNIVALLFFISEKKLPQLFLLQVLGMGQQHLRRFWYKAVVILWVVAIFFSLLFAWFYAYALSSWNIFQVPGSVYHLSRFQISFDAFNIILTFGCVLLAMLLVTWWSMRRRDKVSLISKMRQL